MNYIMCPECFACFFPSEFDPQVNIGQHKDDCSKPKCQRYDKPIEEVMAKIKKDKDPMEKYR